MPQIGVKNPSTEDKQDEAKGVLDTIDAVLDTIEGRTPAKGQSTKAGSVPVVLPSDMGDLPVSLDGETVVLGAGSEVIGSVGFDPRTTTTAALTVSASGDNTAIAAPGAGKHLAIYRLVMTAARGSEVDIILKSAATTKSGAMVADTYDLDFGDAPLICGTNEAFIVNLSAAVAVTGFVQYIEVTE
jgi:hypothetical protein